MGTTVINVASVPHRSPFRYPGGKTWLVPYVRAWLRSLDQKPGRFIEPFAGGGIVGLTVIFENLAEALTLIERDEDVAAVWRTILNGKGNDLASRILSFDFTEGNVRRVLDTVHATLLERAFATIVRNRAQRGGILAPGASLMKNGENGRGLKSRWYPETLHRRILNIVSVRRKISFVQGDAFEAIKKHASDKSAAFFIDPPYTVAGKRLYRYSEIDHSELFRLVSKVKGVLLMTYDESDEILELAIRERFDVARVTMKNTHHSVMDELLIGRNLDWLSASVPAQSFLAL